MADTRAPIAVWRSVRGLPEFWRLLELRAVSQFGDGLFQAGLAGALLFNPERAAGPWEIAAAFAVLFLPYSLLGPFAGALLDRWDRRLVLVGANMGRLVLVLAVAGLLAAGAARPADPARRVDRQRLHPLRLIRACRRRCPHVVPREQVVAMNSVASATGAVGRLPRRHLHAAAPLALRRGRYRRCGNHFHRRPARVAGAAGCRCVSRRTCWAPTTARAPIHGSVAYAVATGWVHGARTVLDVPTVAATLAGLAAHRMVFGINTLLVLVIVRHTDIPGSRGPRHRGALRRRHRHRLVPGDLR